MRTFVSSGPIEEEELVVDQPSKSLYEKLNSSIIWARITRWEFWPFSIFYFPVVFYWIWISLRARSLFFFTASNPSIEFGGMLGESKKKIFDIIPDEYIPKTLKLSPGTSKAEFDKCLDQENLTYPFILKPDIGERGWMVELIKDEKELDQYLSKIKVDFLVQEYIPWDLELGIFYYRYPDCDRGTISSIVMKDMLSVKGDGHKTVRELIMEQARAKMHLDTLEATKPEVLTTVPLYNERIELVSIGNHSRGTTFLNGNHLINQQLIKLFDKVSSQVDGFYFGRYDIRCKSIEDLYEGKHFKILELNGAGSEPAHIYHPGFSLIQAYKDIIHHLKVLTDISIMNQQRGIPYMAFKDGMKEVLRIRRYNRLKEKGL